MNTFHLRAVHEDFAEGLGLGQVGQFTAGHLEADEGAHVAVFIFLIEVRTLNGFDQMEHAAQGNVIGKADDILHRLFKACGDVCLRLAARFERGMGGRIKPGRKQLQQQARDRRIFGERRFLDFLGLVHPALPAIGGKRPDERRLAPGRTGHQDEFVEAIVFGAPTPDREEGLFEIAGNIGKVQRRTICCAHVKGMNPIDIGRVCHRLFRRADRIAGLEIDEEAEIFKHRHTV